MEHKLLGWFLLLLAARQGVAAEECSAAPVFTPDALNLVAAGFRQFGRGGGVKNIDVTQIEVTWKPFLMVENPACLDKTQFSLEMKAGAAADWVLANQSPKEMGGGKYRWTLDVMPCHDHYLRLGVGGGAVLELPKPVVAATEEDIINSKFRPQPPKNLAVKNLADGSVSVSWTPSDCAREYYFYYTEQGTGTLDTHSKMVDGSDGGSTFIMKELKPCRDYELTAAASVRGEDLIGAEETTSFSTPPDMAAAEKLEPIVTAEASSMKVTWIAYDVLSCVNSYEVSVCQEGKA